MTAKKELVPIAILTIGGFVIAVVPWVLLLIEKTKNSVHWLGKAGFQYWGWFLVFCLVGYAFKKTLGLKNSSKPLKLTIQVILLIILGWSLIWAFLVVFGFAISTIV